jgi:branched-chain amino acid transport system permease protein
MTVFSTIISQLFNGLQSGSVYALIALGYSMVYGIIMLLNFAHGDIIMVGAYIAWIMMSLLGLPPVVGVVAAIAGCTILGVTIEKVAYAPLRKSPRLSLLITAIGISFFLENFVQLDFIMGAGAKAMPIIVSGPSVHLVGSNISFVDRYDRVSILSMAILTIWSKKQKWARRCAPSRRTCSSTPCISVNDHFVHIRARRAGIARFYTVRAYPQGIADDGAMLGLRLLVTPSWAASARSRAQ